MTTLDADSFPVCQCSDRGDRPWLVLKFGGTSVSTSANWKIIGELLVERLAAGYRPVVVHSALAGVSNRIQAVLDDAISGAYREGLAGIAAAHLELARDMQLDGAALVGEQLQELERLLSGIHLIGEVSSRVHARAMAFGELMATTLGAAFLRRQGLAAQWLDARLLMRSIDPPNANDRVRFLNASCDFEADAALQERCREVDGVVVTQGFIASNSAGDTVILGRGGSDTSGAYFAAKLQAAGLEIWTDVPGIFSANPRVVDGARLLRTLSYAEAQEIASTGGSVLHPRCIAPVRRHGIPLRIKDTTRPEFPGTLVTQDAGSDAPQVKAILGRAGVTLVSMETLGM
ncbi:MAG: aspartate kinase, partial [Gammaproteobacteria bacterium]|nr:aspartate kinase [Gammaproteobacteria bacterium]